MDSNDMSFLLLLLLFCGLCVKNLLFCREINSSSGVLLLFWLLFWRLLCVLFVRWVNLEGFRPLQIVVYLEGFRPL